MVSAVDIDRFKDKYRKQNKKLNITLIFAIICVMYLFDNLPFIPFRNSITYLYMIKPSLMLGAAYIVWSFPHPRSQGKVRLHGFINSLALIFAGFYIMGMFAGGLIDGLGKSPFSFTPKGIMINIFFVFSLLLWTELSRAYLINCLARKSFFLALGLISLVFTFVALPLNKLLTIKTGLEFVQYGGEQVLPTLAENIMISYLAYLGGPVPALLYHGGLDCFRWFCPVLPNLGWITKTFLGTVLPILSFILVQQLYLNEEWGVKSDKEKPAGWIITSISGVLIIWFAVGLFPIFPSVIITGSMEPVVNAGDIILVKKIDGEDVNVNDIIQYKDGNKNITHRVIDIYKGVDGKRYQTQGDANVFADPHLVSPEQVRGKVIGVIPKLGWFTLMIRSDKDEFASDSLFTANDQWKGAKL
ncbi:MAG: signal peptidase I [Tepidanaerobacteraceae bacterium]|jgi:signal peptidase